MSENPFEMLIDKFEQMEQEKTLDFSVLSDTDSTIKSCLDNEKFWISSEMHPSDTFSMFHAIRNNRLIVEKIRERLVASKKTHDNPKIALDALNILPSMSEIFNFTTSMKDKELSKSVIDFISNRSRILRERAEYVALLPSIRDEAAGLDKRKIRSRLNRLAKAVEEEVFEV